MTWGEFSTTAGQLGVLVAVTGLLYRLFRLWWPDVPEAVMQFIAAILSTGTTLAASYRPETPRYQWLVLGVAGGILMSQNVVKSIDWIASAATKTGAPQVGVPEKPPAWFVAALAQGATIEAPPALITPRSRPALEAQMRANEAAVARATEAPPAATPKPREG